MNRMPNSCPSCGKVLTVTQMKCGRCKTTIEGEFMLNGWMSLDMEKRKFLSAFLKCRGNIKEIGEELGISYPTVRNKLDDLLIVLGFTGSVSKAGKEPTITQSEILERIEKGEISVAEAVRMFTEL